MNREQAFKALFQRRRPVSFQKVSGVWRLNGATPQNLHLIGVAQVPGTGREVAIFANNAQGTESEHPPVLSGSGQYHFVYLQRLDEEKILAREIVPGDQGFRFTENEAEYT